ncbi:MAG: UDP-3-O-[3-hydroxymyristoyl] N-acetylglucosamine deacetylase [Candidatus Eremiobacteraeota bacterium]|nr:UDP-3-O-[3-hydroxymyristoyl] N-acetylglucosamine deacetylase [Candidatus Eremiobacteraeota bacterium]MCW5868512.1 UDP-3-O-[3-hydroxymyristoyl] N-acetylglucosamine deacetylase [Candidatus Eremiobacteraeota bacterium]
MNANRLTQEVHFEGVGVHRGEKCLVSLAPGPAGSGCWMQRDGQRWRCLADSVVEVERCTVLGNGQTSVSTVEHLFAALSSVAVYDCEISVKGSEIPIMDGSALPFVQGLKPFLEPGPAIEPLRLSQPLWVGNEQSQVLALPSPVCRFHYALYYPKTPIGYQEASYEPLSDSFEQKLAPARTFALEREVEWLRAQGLARGGSLNNALVVLADGFSSPLRLEQEMARHKCLDLVGDLYLLGRPLLAQVFAVKAGHRWHVELARKMLRELAENAG